MYMQAEAVDKAVENKLVLIQWPPGTGKTRTAANLMLCLRSFDDSIQVRVSQYEEFILFAGVLCPSNRPTSLIWPANRFFCVPLPEICQQ